MSEVTFYDLGRAFDDQNWEFSKDWAIFTIGTTFYDFGALFKDHDDFLSIVITFS